MTFQGAAWLVPTMVKTQKLSPSCTGMTEETRTTVNHVQSRYQEVCHLSADVSNVHGWDSWEGAQVPQSLEFVDSACAEVSTLLALDSLKRFAGNLFLQLPSGMRSIYKPSAQKRVIHIHLCLLLSPVSDCCSSFLNRALAAPADLRMCSVTSALCNTLMRDNTVQRWA